MKGDNVMKKMIDTKVIFMDSILNVALLIVCIKENLHNVLDETGRIMVLMIYGCILGIFIVADVIYWISKWKKKQISIAYEIARYSVYIKLFAVLVIGIIAIVLYF